MCGILGYTSIVNQLSDFQESLKLLRHRGPDAVDSFVFKSDLHSAIGHTRLSIIDLNEGANQPFVSNCGRYYLSFNGEIYNYLELRDQLLSDGIKFNTRSDTEVLLYMFIKYQEKCLNLLDGIFAFSVFDKLNNNTFLARDQLGVKPLYYYLNKKNKTLIYASEIKSILNFSLVDKSVSRQEIFEFFNNGWLYEPSTGFTNVNRLPSGSYMTIDSSFSSYKFSYYDPTSHINSRSNIHEILNESINSQTISDVKMGLFFSGGVDSSIISLLENKNLPLYFIKYGKKDISKSGYVNDEYYAKKIAHLLNKKISFRTFTQQDLSTDQIFNKIRLVSDLTEELVSDFTTLSTLEISKMARENGYKVMLSGMGGDETFVGYDRYLLIHYYSFFKLIYMLIKPIKNVFKKINKFSKRIDRFCDFFSVNHFPTAYSRTIGYFSSKELHMLFRNKSLQENYKQKLNRILSSVQVKSKLDTALALDYYGFLAHNLTVADKSSMATGLEVRVPLLNHKLYSKLRSLKSSQSISWFSTKLILKRFLIKYLPRNLVYRTKTGFNPPLDNLIIKLGYINIKNFLNNTRIYEILDEKFIDSILTDHFSKASNNTFKVWQILYFSCWLKDDYIISK